jgi:hypothetical protein
MSYRILSKPPLAIPCNTCNTSQTVSIPLAKFFALRVSVRYFRPKFHLIYDNIYEPILDFFGGINLREFSHRIFDRRLRTYEDLNGILLHAVELHKAGFGVAETPISEVISGIRVLTLHKFLCAQLINFSPRTESSPFLRR